MAPLSEQDRNRLSNGLQYYWSNLRETVHGMVKADIRAAVDYTDTWIENNQASYVSGLPEPFKSNSTALQKTIVFAVTAILRVTPGIPEMLRRALGVVVD